MTAFTDELRQQPAALSRLLAYYDHPPGLSALLRFAQVAKQTGALHIAGLGSSQYAALSIAKRVTAAGLRLRCLDAGELLHYGALPADELSVLLSQSGESAEIVRLLARAATASPEPVVAITNHRQSALGVGADLVLPLCAGAEETITTKTWSNSLGLCALLAGAIEGSPALAATRTAVSDLAARQLALDEESITEAATSLAEVSGLAFVGRGPALAAAQRCALTFTEGARLLCSAFSGGVFREGPLAAAGPELGVVILIPAEAPTAGLSARLAAELSRRGARVVALVQQRDLPLGDARIVVLPSARVGGAGLAPRSTARLRESLYPLAAAAAQGLLLDAFARARGVEEGLFRHGKKITADDLGD